MERTTEIFPVGQRVRFRLGERGPFQLPCCGEWIEPFDYLAEFTGKIFTVGRPTCRQCFFCKYVAEPSDTKITLVLKRPWFVEGIEYSSIGAYPQELELVLDEGQ